MASKGEGDAGEKAPVVPDRKARPGSQELQAGGSPPGQSSQARGQYRTNKPPSYENVDVSAMQTNQSKDKPDTKSS